MTCLISVHFLGNFLVSNVDVIVVLYLPDQGLSK